MWKARSVGAWRVTRAFSRRSYTESQGVIFLSRGRGMWILQEVDSGFDWVWGLVFPPQQMLSSWNWLHFWLRFICFHLLFMLFRIMYWYKFLHTLYCIAIGDTIILRVWPKQSLAKLHLFAFCLFFAFCYFVCTALWYFPLLVRALYKYLVSLVLLLFK